jgi:hypothetical protein
MFQHGSKPAPTVISRTRHSPLNPWVLDRYGLVGCDVLKRSVSSDGALSAFDTPNSLSPAPLLCTSMPIFSVSWCCAIHNCSKEASLLSSTPVSLFNSRTDSGTSSVPLCLDRWRFGALTVSNVRSTCAFSSNWSDLPSDGCNAQCSTLSLSSGTVMHNAPHYPCLQAL